MPYKCNCKCNNNGLILHTVAGINYTLNAWKNLIEDKGLHPREVFAVPG